MSRVEGVQPDSSRSWLVLLAGTVGMIFTFGTPFSYGVHLGPLGEHFDVDPVSLSLVFSVELFTFFVVAGLVAILTSKLPARTVLGICTGLLAGFAPALYVVDSYLGLIVVFAVLGTVLGTVFVLLSAVVPQWFERRQGLATGILFVGNGFGLFVLPPAWQLAFDRLGVPDGFLAITFVSALAFLGCAVVCRRPPWQETRTLNRTRLRNWLSETVRARTFHLLFPGLGLSFAWYHLLAAYLIELFQTRGYSPFLATTAFGFIGGVSLVSRIGAGTIADRIGHSVTFVASLAFAAAGGLLLFVPSASIGWMAVASFGIALGGVSALYVPLVLQEFSDEMGTPLLGLFNFAFAISALTAPPLATGLLAYTGSFLPHVVLTVCVPIGAIVVIWWGVSSRMHAWH